MASSSSSSSAAVVRRPSPPSSPSQEDTFKEKLREIKRMREKGMRKASASGTLVRGLLMTQVPKWGTCCCSETAKNNYFMRKKGLNEKFQQFVFGRLDKSSEMHFMFRG